MPSMRVVLDPDGTFPELQHKKVHKVQSEIVMTVLEHGMKSGAPSVALVIPLEDGSVVFAETSAKLILTAAAAIKGKYGDDF